jgi:hypothetical protein
MSDDVFLARWSRRKREAKAVANVPPPTEPAGTPNPAPPAAAENPPDAEVDLSSLPPIDSIDAATDITAFLRKGIPQELSHAALRRAWAADPAIRDFVGLAENAWDFNDPNAMPGFGPLDCSAKQIDALVGRIVGGVRSAADSLTTAVAEGKQDCQSNDSGRAALSEPHPSEAVADLATGEELSRDEPSEGPAAVQPEPSETDRAEAVLRRRTHGGALPR